MSLESKPAFLKKGLDKCMLKASQNNTRCQLLFIMDKILGPIESTISLNKTEGITSQDDLVGFMCAIIFLSCKRETGMKQVN